MRVLFIGDIVGRTGRLIAETGLGPLRQKEKIDVVVANGENAAGGSGLTPRITKELLNSGIDVLTSGDHIWKKKEIYDLLDSTDRLIRPLNYPEGAPGKGFTVIDIPGSGKLAVINLIGRVFMDAVDCPFAAVKEAIAEIEGITPGILVDMHAEATSEKVAMGWYLDGKVSAVVGTHTHIQTADEKILPGGTAYITDCGMTGPYDSVIGRKKEKVLERFVTQLPTRFEMADGQVEMHGVLIDIDNATGKARNISRIQHSE
ncbi:MAG: TIGR00282 family metallophosphoesterase [Candidatus Omnitrophica bacterium]|nr:TIGR00282 family metallophosphoesterase [Candidatus Omnitrophota bacterium]